MMNGDDTLWEVDGGIADDAVVSVNTKVDPGGPCERCATGRLAYVRGLFVAEQNWAMLLDCLVCGATVAAGTPGHCAEDADEVPIADGLLITSVDMGLAVAAALDSGNPDEAIEILRQWQP